MVFISHIRSYMAGIIAPVTEVLPGGLVREIVPEFSIEFRLGGLTLEEVEFGEKVFQSVSGRTMMQDEVTQTPVSNRLSRYDSEAPDQQQAFEQVDRALDGMYHPDLPRDERWTPGTMQRLTEQFLVRSPDNGSMYMVFEAEPVAPPWPTYAEFVGSPEDLLAVLDAQGHVLPDALAWERQNLNRPDVIALLEEKIGQEELVA